MSATDLQIQAKNLFNELKSIPQVAERMGATNNNVLKHIARYAINQGLLDDGVGGHHEPGFATYATSKLIKHAPNDEGRVMTWYKDKINHAYINELAEYLEDRIPCSPADITVPVLFDEDLMLELIIADAHIGAMCWKAETGDSNYDLKTASKLYLSAVKATLERHGHVKEIRLVLLGDITHTNGIKALTPASLHPLDVDSRWPKIMSATRDILYSVIEMCANYCEKIKVYVIQGNHDEDAAFSFQLILDAYFRLINNIDIDMSPAKTRFDTFGVSAFAYAHGDKTKLERIAGDLLTWIARNDITGVRDFYAKQGHLHSEKKLDINGVICEVITTMFPLDSFASGGNWSSKRALISSVYHRNKGLVTQHIVTPRQLDL